VKHIITLQLDESIENRLSEFMNQDRISHFYAIYDLERLREKSRAWVALTRNNIAGYMIEFDERISYMRGNKECAFSLLRNSRITLPLFNIEPQHLSAVNKLYKIAEPADRMTKGQITTFTPMKTTSESFKPFRGHSVQELKKEHAQALASLLDADRQTTLDLLKGYAFGIFKGDKLVSFAASPDILEDLAIIRGVYTELSERNKGYSTSVCSALVEKLLKQGKEVFLYVSRDNPAAIKVYKKIGFSETGHIFLGFKAQKRIGKVT